MPFLGIIIINISLVQLNSSIIEMGKHIDHNYRYVIILHNIPFPFRKEIGYNRFSARLWRHFGASYCLSTRQGRTYLQYL